MNSTTRVAVLWLNSLGLFEAVETIGVNEAAANIMVRLPSRLEPR
jgi:hypothetical protein